MLLVCHHRIECNDGIHFSGFYLSPLAFGRQSDSHSNYAMTCDAYILQHPSNSMGSYLHQKSTVPKVLICSMKVLQQRYITLTTRLFFLTF